jgi:hypothetical protein
MLRKINALKLMNALARLFVLIRYEPENPVHIELIKSFQNHFKNDNDYFNLKILIRALRDVQENENRDSLIRELRTNRLKAGSIEINKVLISIQIINEILDQILLNILNSNFEKVKYMSDAVHNYPVFLTREQERKDIWTNINYYTEPFGEDFLSKWMHVFKEY